MNLTNKDKPICPECCNCTLYVNRDKHRWIPVSERLPEIGEEVLILTKTKPHRVFVADYEETKRFSLPNCTVSHLVFQTDITHWRKITLPEGEPNENTKD